MIYQHFIFQYSTAATFHKLGDCCQCVLAPFQKILGLDNNLLFKDATFLEGGIGLTGKTCGTLSERTMVLGTLYGREDFEEGAVKVLENMPIAEELVKKFGKKFGTTVCREIINVNLTDKKALSKFSGSKAHEKCFEVVRETAGMVAEIIANRES